MDSEREKDALRDQSLGGRNGLVGTQVGPVVPWALLEGVFEQILVALIVRKRRR